MKTVLSQALEFTLGNEGGYSNHPSDPGGATNFGITQRALDHWNALHSELNFPNNVKNLAQNQAEAIYRADYWRWDLISSPSIAIKLFDIGVNAGVTTAVKLLQRAVNSLIAKPIPVDGQLGPMTLREANAQPVDALLTALCYQQASFYFAIVERDPSQSVFLKGWLVRAARKPPQGLL